MEYGGAVEQAVTKETNEHEDPIVGDTNPCKKREELQMDDLRVNQARLRLVARIDANKKQLNFRSVPNSNEDWQY